MSSLITPIILILISVGLYFTFTKDEYAKVKALQAENAGYETAIANSKDLLATRDQLLDQYNSIPAEDLKRLEKMMPDNIDNVRLIIEMNAILQRFGLPPRNIAIEAPKGDKTAIAVNDSAGKNYRSATLTFEVTTTYDTFQRLIKELESSLRILDVTTVSISAGNVEPYQYTFTVKTYWMK